VKTYSSDGIKAIVVYDDASNCLTSAYITVYALVIKRSAIFSILLHLHCLSFSNANKKYFRLWPIIYYCYFKYQTPRALFSQNLPLLTSYTQQSVNNNTTQKWRKLVLHDFEKFCLVGMCKTNFKLNKFVNFYEMQNGKSRILNLW